MWGAIAGSPRGGWGQGLLENWVQVGSGWRAGIGRAGRQPLGGQASGLSMPQRSAPPCRPSRGGAKWQATSKQVPQGGGVANDSTQLCARSLRASTAWRPFSWERLKEKVKGGLRGPRRSPGRRCSYTWPHHQPFHVWLSGWLAGCAARCQCGCCAAQCSLCSPPCSSSWCRSCSRCAAGPYCSRREGRARGAVRGGEGGRWADEADGLPSMLPGLLWCPAWLSCAVSVLPCSCFAACCSV